MEVFCQADLSPLMKDSKNAKKALQRAFGEMVDLAYWAFQRLVDLTPKGQHSTAGNRVADSWELKFLHYVLFRELAWSVESENEIIGYLEYGTRDHWIFPRFAKVLHWIDPNTGEDRFSAGHIVSGIKPVGMIRRTEAEMEGKIAGLQSLTAKMLEN